MPRARGRSSHSRQCTEAYHMFLAVLDRPLPVGSSAAVGATAPRDGRPRVPLPCGLGILAHWPLQYDTVDGNQQRSYHSGHARSLQHSDAKLGRAELVLRWGTTRESSVLLFLFAHPRQPTDRRAPSSAPMPPRIHARHVLDSEVAVFAVQWACRVPATGRQSCS